MPRLGKLGFLLLVGGVAPLFPATVEAPISAFGDLHFDPPGFTGTIVQNFPFQGFDAFNVVGTLQSVHITGVGGAGEGNSSPVGQFVDLSIEGIIPILLAFDFGGSSNTGPIPVDLTITDPSELQVFEPSDLTLVNNWEVFASLQEGEVGNLSYSFDGFVEYTYSTSPTVPEPAQFLLVALGLVGLVMRRHCRGKASG